MTLNPTTANKAGQKLGAQARVLVQQSSTVAVDNGRRAAKTAKLAAKAGANFVAGFFGTLFGK